MSLKSVISQLEKVEYSAIENWNGSWGLSCNKWVLCTNANEEIVKDIQKILTSELNGYVEHLKLLEVPKQGF